MSAEQIYAPEPSNPTGFARPGGWLLFFCLTRIVIQPMLNIAQAFGDNSPIGWLLYLLDTAFSIYVGLLIYRLNVRALRAVKIYLILLMVVSALFILGSIGASGTSAGQNDADELLKAGIRTLGFGLIWFIYFKRSKRVRATFGRNI